MIRCGCGRSHADAAALVKVGWQALGSGDCALLVNCTCRSTICADLVTDACICDRCHRLVTGTVTDPKICIVDEAEGPLVLCASCFRRDPRNNAWLAWDDRAMGADTRPMLRDAAGVA